MRALELRGNQVEVFGLLSTLRGRNPVRQTAGCTQRVTPAVPATPARENRPDQVPSTSRKAPHRWSEPPGAATPEVREAMLAVLPSLRAFAISLTGNRNAAEDLVQEAILRAWTNLDKFEPGSSMGAWLFTILRNAFYSNCRKTRREVDDPEGVHAGRLGTPPNQGYSCELQELVEALAKLPPVLREALILVGAQGMTYEEAAQVAGVPSGTLKSRVSRARARLAHLLAIDDSDNGGPDSMTQAALQSAG